jgi:hypothetical protein
LKYGVDYTNQVKINKLYVIKQVKSATMNSLFFMLCQFHTVAQSSSISNHVYSILNLTKSGSFIDHMTIKKTNAHNQFC